MDDYVAKGTIRVARVLAEFVEREALPVTGMSPNAFWRGLATILNDLTPRNRALLAERDHLQCAVDRWYGEHPGPVRDIRAFRGFLRDIGYLRDVPAGVIVSTSGVDPEIALQAGPQLVVPVTNARYALNAANARWGSLYDALYGTNVIAEDGGSSRTGAYNPTRGKRVIEFARRFLDDAIPLVGGSHADATAYTVSGGNLLVMLKDGRSVRLAIPSALLGYRGDPAVPEALVFAHHRLRFEIQIDPTHPIGSGDPAHVKDIVLEAAVTAIVDFEDSISAVDADDKVTAYRNWLGMMQGTLTARFEKAGKTVTRCLRADRSYTAVNGEIMPLPGRALLLVRNVSHHMFTDAILDRDGRSVPEGLLDAVFTSLIAVNDLGSKRNSQSASVYIVKPKMHGPDEVAFAVETMERTEALLGLPKDTLKLGIMDEERRTTLNLTACIAAAAERAVFINTGFLDRTGDEIHTSMRAGPMVRKADMKGSVWLGAYERNNVQAGLACGFRGRAQIGKGMWAMPDQMAEMLREKVGQLELGASTAWVPSPTAATLHALHYHKIDVEAVQKSLDGQHEDYVDRILAIPVVAACKWSTAEIQQELDNNCQGILGYVVRWVEQGVGCSKVPNIHNVGMMEDRATLRISSQHVANWLLHGVATPEQVQATLRRMAGVVDRQNADDPVYQPMAEHGAMSSCAFKAASDLIFNGASAPNGYTEVVLHHWRRLEKARGGSRTPGGRVNGGSSK